MKSATELSERFRAAGLRVTPQRRAVFRYLSDIGEHPTAEVVHAAIIEEMPTVSMRTVYQTLNDLATMGELSPLNVGRESTRFDTNVAPHHHLMCERCGDVIDVPADLTTLQVPDGLPNGFSVSHTEIVLHGTCGSCAQYGGAPAPLESPMAEEADHA